MVIIMDNLLGNADQKGDFCFLANLKKYLSAYKIWYEEFWLGGIVGVMGFYFTTITTGIPSVVHGRSEEFESLFSRLNEYFIKPLQKEQFTCKELALNRISDLLEAKVIPMLWLDEFFLPEAYNYQKSHLWVMAVILEDSDTALTIFSNEKIMVSKANMNQMMQKDGIIEIQYTLDNQIGWKYTEKELVVKGLLQVVDNIRKISKAQEEYYGITGMRHFKLSFEKSQNQKEIYKYFYEMNRGGGLYKTRRNMRMFLEEVMKKWPCDEAHQCVLIYGEIERQWEKISNLIFKLSIYMDLALQQRIAKRIEQIIILEEQGIEHIENLIKILVKIN